LHQVIQSGSAQNTSDPAYIPLADGQAVSGVIFGQVVSADLQVTKLETPGGKWCMIYTITATNKGLANGVDTILTDVLSGNVNFVSVTTSLCT